MVRRCSGQNDSPHGEECQCSQHDVRVPNTTHHVTSEDCSNETGETAGDELSGSEEGRDGANDLEKLPEVVDPDAESGPAASDACEDEHCICVENAWWDKRIGGSLLDKNKQHKGEEAKDE